MTDLLNPPSPPSPNAAAPQQGSPLAGEKLARLAALLADMESALDGPQEPSSRLTGRKLRHAAEIDQIRTCKEPATLLGLAILRTMPSITICRALAAADCKIEKAADALGVASAALLQYVIADPVLCGTVNVAIRSPRGSLGRAFLIFDMDLIDRVLTKHGGAIAIRSKPNYWRLKP